MRRYSNFLSVVFVPLLFFIIEFAAIESVRAAEIQAGSLKLSDPEWSITNQKDTVFLLENSSGGSALLMYQTFSGGDREQAFRNFLATVGSEKPEDWGMSQAVTTKGYDVLYSTKTVQIERNKVFVIPVAFFSGNEMIVVMLFNPRDRERDDLESSFGKLLSSAEFTNNPPPQLNLTTDQSIDGFYVTIGTESRVSVFGAMTLSSELQGLWMQPDGRYAVTEIGIKEDFDAYCGDNPLSCGRYKISNDRFTTWLMPTALNQRIGLARIKTETFARSQDDLILGETRHTYIPPVSDLKLDGQYTYQRSERLFVGYTFGADGKFQHRDNNQIREGTYKIDNYTLTLNYNNGETQIKSFFIYEGIPTIDGTLYQKR